VFLTDIRQKPIHRVDKFNLGKLYTACLILSIGFAVRPWGHEISRIGAKLLTNPYKWGHNVIKKWERSHKLMGSAKKDFFEL
jgi:hypothetical protein